MRVLVDQPLAGLGRDRLHILAGGPELAAGAASGTAGTWVEPVNNHLLLEPVCLNSSWATSNTSPYNKLPLSSFTTAGSWETHTLTARSSGPWLSFSASSSSATGEIYTTGTYSKNRGIVLSCYNYAGEVSQTTKPLLTFGWGQSVYTSTLYFAVYGNGTVDVYRNGNIYMSDTINTLEAKQKDKKVGEFLDIIAIPYNHNQILMYSGNGGSFVVEFDDIEAGDTDPTITPSGSIFVAVPAGMKSKFQIAPVTFASSGFMYSDKLNFIEPPASGAAKDSYYSTWLGTTPYQLFGYKAYVGTQSASAEAVTWSHSAFTADGSSLNAKIKFSLSTNNTGYSPTIVGGQVSYAAASGSTASGTVDITQFTQSLSLDVPENPEDVRLSLTLVEATSALIAVPRLDTMLHRPILVEDDQGVVLFQGIITDIRGSTENLHTTYQVEARNNWKMLDDYIFRERVPVVTGPLTGWVGFLADKGFCQTASQISSSSVEMPFRSAKEPDDWGKMIQVGDTAGRALIDLMDSFAGNWIYGYGPSASGYRFFAYHPDTLPGSGSVSKVLYTTSLEASAAGLTGSVLPLIKSFTSQRIPAEATEVRVTGYNPRSKTLFQSYKVDTAAEDISLAPADRPDNWRGGKLSYGLVEPAITTQEMCDYACNLLYPKLTRPRDLVEWHSIYLKDASNQPVWIGKSVCLSGLGYYRVTSLSLDWQGNSDSKIYATYTGEKL